MASSEFLFNGACENCLRPNQRQQVCSLIISGSVPVTSLITWSCVMPSWAGDGGLRAPLTVELYKGHLGGDSRFGHWNLKSYTFSGGKLSPTMTSTRIFPVVPTLTDFSELVLPRM